MTVPERIGRSAEPLEWLEGALERLRACSLAALRCVEAGELEMLAPLLEEREALLERAAPLLSGARAPRLETALEGVLAADRRLSEALAGRLAGVSDELTRLGDRARVAITGAVPSAGRRIDLVR
jgi:hypothetical protein